MPCFRLTLAYDGTDFSGWQIQLREAPPAARTVQGVLEEALARLAGEPVRVSGASRTDAGVHALGQVASFAMVRAMGAGDLGRALNGLLPPDVRVLDAETVGPDFHARKSAGAKLYRYELDTGPIRLPTRRRRAGHVPWALEPSAVAEAAALYLGRRDFASLASAGGSAKTTVRTVLRSEATWRPPLHPRLGPILVYEVSADGFLRKMVRSMVGGLVAAGRGAASPDDLRAALDERDRRRWPAPVEACGLTLLSVTYEAAPGAGAPIAIT